MKKLALIALLAMFALSLAAQAPVATNDDLQTAKTMLADYAIYCKKLETQNAQMIATINMVRADLPKIKTVAQLDSLKKAYGITEAKGK